MDQRQNGGTTPPEAGPVVAMAFAFWSSRLLLCADQVGVFTALAEAPADLATLAARLRLRRENLADLLSGLVQLGLIERREGRYRLGRDAYCYLVRSAPAYIGSWLAMARAAMADATDLAASMRDAGTVEIEPSLLNQRMWDDIGEVLRTVSMPDGAS